MGTFHSDTHPLHGITCVVLTREPRTWVGRVDGEEGTGLVLLDADACDGATDGVAAALFLRNAARFGHWPRQGRVVVPRSAVVSVRRLSDLPVE